MAIRIEQLHVGSISRVFVTRIELDSVVTSRINEYIDDYLDVGEGIHAETYADFSGRRLELKSATETELGGIKIGKGLEINEDGVVSTLPILTYDEGESISIKDSSQSTDKKVISVNRASESTFGTLKLGNGLKLNEDGSTQVDFELIPTNIDKQQGLIQIGTGLELDNGITNVNTNKVAELIKGENIDLNEGKLEVNTSKIAQSIKGNGIEFKNDKLNVTTYEFEEESFTTNKSYDETTKRITLNPSTKDRLGGIKIGDDFAIDEYGILHNNIDLSKIDELQENLITLGNLYYDLIFEFENLSKIVNNALIESPVHYYEENFIAGTITFEGTETTILFKQPVENTDYKVYLTSSLNTAGKLGELWVENKTVNGFTIRSSGSETSDLGTLKNMQIDWMVFLDETNTEEYHATNFPFQKGTTKLNNEAGRYISLEHILSSTDYNVFICAAENPNGYYGETWIEEKTTNGFTLKTCGTSTTCDVDYLVVPTGKDIYDEDAHPFITGNATFNGYKEGVTIEIGSNFTNLKYQVLISAEDNPGGCLGDVWVDKKTGEFIVYNTGSAQTKFSYLIIGK
jgi:hypothetical protein